MYYQVFNSRLYYGAFNLLSIETVCERQVIITDYPSTFQFCFSYFEAGGTPEHVINQLSQNYSATAQMANILSDWLVVAGVDNSEVQAMVENHLKEMILKIFDPKKADLIFTEEGSPIWLTDMIEHKTWRDLMYRLAEEYPDCLILNFIIKLISDNGYQSEITSISTAAQQLEVFSRVLKTSITKILSNTDDWQSSVQELAKMVCHGQHTYVYSQVLIQVLSQEAKGGSNMKRLSQEIMKFALKSNLTVTPITMALYGNTPIEHSQACEALTSMLARNALNPADIAVLHRYFSTDTPPPIELIRNSQFLDLLVDALFKAGVKINPEHRMKYIYLLAYASSVSETLPTTKKGANKQKVILKDELKSTMKAITQVHSICNLNKGSTELVAELQGLYTCIQFPVVGVGLIRWIENTVTEPSFFKLCTESTPIPLAIIDEVASVHPSLHDQILKLLIRLFESKQDELEILVQLELKKMLLDRMINLLTCGCVMPVVKYIKQCCTKGDTDISLIRYFVTEVLETITHPYSQEFVALFLPMVENEDITGRLNNEENDPIAEFIGKTNIRNFNYKLFINYTLFFTLLYSPLQSYSTITEQ